MTGVAQGRNSKQQGRARQLCAVLACALLSAPAAAGPLGPGAAKPPPPRPAALVQEPAAKPPTPPAVAEAPQPPAPAPTPTPAPAPAPPAPPTAPLAVAPLAQSPEAGPAVAAAPERRGPVTNLPLPRYVSLKTSQGNARRGPGTSHRIDWVFTRPGMPLRVIGEYENWRRVEDAEGAGGWVHYALLSGSRSVLVRRDMAELRSAPGPDSTLIAHLQAGVIARLIACAPAECRLQVEGWRGWVAKGQLWGVEANEVFE